ncbi:putative protein TPRXL [Plectropomus leopardus]|uniref:putative protein TPRXL n=1 Tax=Plectropomus leopardus TaxID=160734 RepID=UPI001C4BC0B1|nr:putative protein TPRXL [Plectropomus leopardus]
MHVFIHSSVHSGEQVNLTTSSSSSIRPVLTQLPPPPPRPVKRSFGSQPAAWAAVSQQDRAGWPSSSSSSSSRVSFSFSDSSGYMSAPSSLSLPLSQPAPSSSSSSSVLPPLHPLSEIPVISAPKLVPIFKNKCPSRHVNVALLRHQKQLIGGVEERGRVALPTFGKTSLAAASASSSSCVSFLSAASLPVPPARIVPRFSRRPKPAVSPAPQTAGTPKVKHVPTLSPASKPAIILTAKPEPKLKSSLKTNGKFSRDSAGPVQPAAAAAEPPPPSSEASNSTKRVMFESKPKKSRSAIRDVDVEQMARSYQLSKLNSATLLAWLKGRGVRLSAKHRKEELMLKVMSCLAES